MRVAGYEALEKAGDFYWTYPQGVDNPSTPDRLMFRCPCGCEILAGVTVKPVNPNGWDWDGNLEQPTILPSILINHGHWHGYLTGGVFKTC